MPQLSIWRSFVKQIMSKRFWYRRVPVKLQMNEAECGAACLAMILSYFGRKTSVSECRTRFGAGRDGIPLRTMVKVAREFGLQVHAYSVELSHFSRISIPAIVYWNFNHFVVVERWSPQKVVIVDPGHGRRTVTGEEFSNSFTGVAITFRADSAFERLSTTKSPNITYLKQLLRLPGLSGLLIQIAITSLLVQFIGLSVPFFTKIVVDQVIPDFIGNTMSILLIGVGIVILAQMVNSYLRSVLLLFFQARYDAHITRQLFAHLLKLPFGFFQQRTVGDLLTRLSSSTVIRELLTSQTLSIILNSLFVLVYVVILLLQAPLFGLVAGVIGALEVALLFVTAPRMHSSTQRHLIAQAEEESLVVQTLHGIATVKATGTENLLFDYWSSLFFREINMSLQRSQLSALINTALETLRLAGSLLLLWIGALFVLNHTMSLGTMLSLNVIASAFLISLASLVGTGQQLQLVGAHLSRIADIIEAVPEQKAPNTLPEIRPELTGRIEVKQVSFRYDLHAPYVLENISLEIKQGQKVALVGRTGSGKSTLALLLLGLYSATEGEIFYDSHSLTDLGFEHVRSQCGVVLQEPFLFRGSILQNISLSDPKLSLEEVSAAARLSGIHDDIMRMPMRYETILSEGGGGLSGGQRQRIALARALAHKPRILLLDEATSHLDVMTEALVEDNLSQLECTRIVIAHRLSTIRDADLIIVIDHGCIVEQGTHEDLLAKNAFYASLIHKQLNYSTDEHSSLEIVMEE